MYFGDLYTLRVRFMKFDYGDTLFPTKISLNSIKD